jgi:anti-anti-sigma factor
MRYQISAETMMSDGVLVVQGRGSAALVVLAERSLREPVAADIRDRLLELAHAAGGRIALSLAEVHDLSSAGINALIAVNTRCKQLGGLLVCFAPEAEITRMLRITKLDRAIIVRANSAEAIQTLEEPSRTNWLARALKKTRPQAA